MSEDPIGEAEDLIATGRARDAATLLQNLIDANRGGLLARLTLARALREAGDLSAALATARETAMLNPNVAVVVIALGEVLLASGRLPTAIAEFQRALRLDPENTDARFLLGCAWLEAGEPDKALEAFAQIENHAGLGEKLAEAEAMRSAPRSNPRYVRHLFDQFSSDYDARMIGQLGYRAPAILRELAALVLPVQSRLRILDLGCGTGLSGAAFADMAGAIDGVDLSPAMVAKARERGVYRTLFVGDIETALHGLADCYDLALAADTVVYLGDIAPLLAQLSRKLPAGGYFLFTVEKADGEGFELGPKRRWRHSQSYLRAAATHAGFDICGFVDCVPRSEAGVAVEGHAVALCRRDGSA
ncbi:MAG TPA: tetratricopeptide repeat protein [Rhizomicrobium sp.]